MSVPVLATFSCGITFTDLSFSTSSTAVAALLCTKPTPRILGLDVGRGVGCEGDTEKSKVYIRLEIRKEYSHKWRTKCSEIIYTVLLMTTQYMLSFESF